MANTDRDIIVLESALKHGVTADHIVRMWYDSNCEGFDVRRLPPRETNVIAIRFLSSPEGTLEMIAEEETCEYRIFHAQIVPEGNVTSLLIEAFKLCGLLG